MNIREDNETARDALRLRLDAVKEASTRSRIALLACTVAALCLLIVDYNMYLSWNRDFALQVDGPTTPAGPELARTKFAQEQLVSNWVASTSTDMPLLGSRVNASDATVLGGGALYFLTLWLFYSMRRENRLIGSILRNTRDATIALNDLVYSGIISHMVFTATRVQPHPISSLSNKPVNAREPKPIKTLPAKAVPDLTKPRRLPGTQLLFILPPLMILASLTFDVLSVLWLDAPFRATHHIKPSVLLSPKALAILSLGALCLVATGWNSWRIARWDRATGAILRDYGDMLHAKSVMRDLLLRPTPGAPFVQIPNGTLGLECNVDIVVSKGDDRALYVVFADSTAKKDLLERHGKELGELHLAIGGPTADPSTTDVPSAPQAPQALPLETAPENAVRLKYEGAIVAEDHEFLPRLVFRISRTLSS